MYCPNCGTEFDNNMNFCPNCGTKRPQPKSAVENSPHQQDTLSHEVITNMQSDASSNHSKDSISPKKKRKLPLIAGILCIVVIACIAVAVLSRGGNSSEISTVQNGYLGEFTNMTVKEILDGYYMDTLNYEEGIWDSGITDDGTTIVQVEYTNETLGNTTIQFSMANENCFKITAFVDPLEEIKDPSDLLAVLNKIYLVSYESQYPSEQMGAIETKLLTELTSVNATSVRYGASQDYEGDRSQLYQLFGDTQLEMNVVELLSSYGIVNTEAQTGEEESEAPEDIPEQTTVPNSSDEQEETSAAYEAGKAAAWKVYNTIFQYGYDCNKVVTLNNSDSQQATDMADGFYDEAVLMVGYTPYNTYTYNTSILSGCDFTVFLM